MLKEEDKTTVFFGAVLNENEIQQKMTFEMSILQCLCVKIKLFLFI